MTLIEDAIADYLEDQGVAPRIYAIEGAPDEADEALTVTPYLGTPVDADQATVGDLQNVQIFSRGATRLSGSELSWSAYEALLNAQESAAPFAEYVILTFNQSPSYIGRDEKKRYLYSFNLQLQKKLTD